MTADKDFIDRASTEGLHLRVGEIPEPEGFDSSEALFHLPLLSLVMLVIAHGRKGAFTTSELSTWTSGVLMTYFEGLREASKALSWSIALRTRCADSLVFLENADLVRIVGTGRRLELTENGKSFLSTCFGDRTEVGTLSRGLRRAVDQTKTRGLVLL